jgi:hypothetical protein
MDFNKLASAVIENVLAKLAMNRWKKEDPSGRLSDKTPNEPKAIEQGKKDVAAGKQNLGISSETPADRQAQMDNLQPKSNLYKEMKGNPDIQAGMRGYFPNSHYGDQSQAVGSIRKGMMDIGRKSPSMDAATAMSGKDRAANTIVLSPDGSGPYSPERQTNKGLFNVAKNEKSPVNTSGYSKLEQVVQNMQNVQPAAPMTTSAIPKAGLLQKLMGMFRR